jgi:hypothetical protein
MTEIALKQSVGLAHLDAGDLRDGVPLIRRLERPREQRRFLQGLRRQARVDAARAEKAELARPGAIRGVDDVRLDLEVVANEIGRVAVVGNDTADLRRSQEHVVGPLGREEAVDGCAVAQVESAAARGENAREAACCERAADRGTHEPARAGHEYVGFLVHSWCL